MHSAVYRGHLRHERSAPKRHAFVQKLYMLYLDLDEVGSWKSGWLFGIGKWRPLSFRPTDYLSKGQVIAEVKNQLQIDLTGPVRLLTQVRSFGYVFNPVSFYYCFDADGQTLQAVVAEITNTPWSERHRYTLRASENGVRARFAKQFHVSPFFPMTHDYDWRLPVPGNSLAVRMINYQKNQPVFCAQLTLRRREFSTRTLVAAILRHPFMALKVHTAIYLHAFLLWCKRVPFFPHPRLHTSPATRNDSNE